MRLSLDSAAGWRAAAGPVLPRLRLAWPLLPALLALGNLLLLAATAVARDGAAAGCLSDSSPSACRATEAAIDLEDEEGSSLLAKPRPRRHPHSQRTSRGQAAIEEEGAPTSSAMQAQRRYEARRQQRRALSDLQAGPKAEEEDARSWWDPAAAPPAAFADTSLYPEAPDLGSRPMLGSTHTGVPSPSPTPISMQDKTIAGWWLGSTFDLNEEDLWQFEHTLREPIFEENIIPSCYVEVPCRLGEAHESKTYHSTEAWIRDAAQSMGLGISATMPYFQGTINAAMSSSSSQTRSEGVDIATMMVHNTQKCYGMSRRCTNDRRYLREILVEVVDGLPAYPGVERNESAMIEWQKKFIHRFGTHVSVFSRHGAETKAMTSLANNCAKNEFELKSSFCLLAFTTLIDFELCSNGTNNELTESCKNTRTQSCVTLGGHLVDVDKSPCGPPGQITHEDLRKFLRSGNPDAATSVFSYKFAAISDILLFSHPELEAASAALESAMEYHSCRSSWINGTCQCDLKCFNGGELDETSCTCKCRGDKFHGWTGRDCSSTYGTCQAGPGTPNFATASMCAARNVCQSATHSYACKPTDVCCLTCFKGKCCPFGSSCQCTVNNCRCMFPDGTFSDWGESAHASNPQIPCRP